MQLRIQRSQRAGGVIGNTIFFCLDVRADYSAEERSNIQRYRLGNEVIYNSQRAQKHLENAGTHLDRTQSGGVGERAAGLARGALSLALAKMSLNISIASLGKGHHIECKDLEELLEAEETVRTACKNVTRYLDAAATFNGSEIVIEYANGEERVHVTQQAPPLLEYQPGGTEMEPTASSIQRSHEPGPALVLWAKFTKALKERWLNFERGLLYFCTANGLKIEETHFRAFCGVVGLVLFIVILQVR